MKYLKDWKVHLWCLILVVVAEFIGMHAFGFWKVSFKLFPMLFALVIGIVLSQFKVFSKETMETASPYIGIAVMFLTVKMGAEIGPSLKEVMSAGPALLLQELGNLGTVFLSLPIAVLVFKMGREAVGCSFSISREDALAIVGDVYGLDSDEGRGVMGGYITGTLLGTLFNGLLVSGLISLNIFHPYALAMAAGTGSASMMSAALAPVVEAFPAMSETLTAYAATSQVLTGLDGLYVSLFVALPLANFLYKRFRKVVDRKKAPVAAAEVQPAPDDAEIH